MATATMPMMDRFRLREDYVRPFRDNSNVDRAAGIVRNVKVLGTISGNGYRYPFNTLREAAPLYEGMHVYFNPHPPKLNQRRDPAKKIAWLENVRVAEDGLYADLHLLLSHEDSAKILEAAEKNPSLYSLSHDASHGGNLTPPDATGYKTVNRITEVYAIDIVDRGGTTHGLYEDLHVTKTTLRKLIDAENKLPAAVKARLLEDDFGGVLDQEIPVPDAEGEEGDYKTHLVQAIEKLCRSDSPEDHELIKKIVAMLKPEAAKTDDTPAAEVTEDDKSDEDKDEDAMKEELQTLRRDVNRLTEERNQLALRGQINEELTIADFPEIKDKTARTKLVDNLSTMGSIDRVREHLKLVREQIIVPARRGSSGPRSSGPLTIPPGTKPKTTAEAIEEARRR